MTFTRSPLYFSKCSWICEVVIMLFLSFFSVGSGAEGSFPCHTREVLTTRPPTQRVSGFFAHSVIHLVSLLELLGENPIQKPELYDKFKRRLFFAVSDLVFLNFIS